MRSNLRFRDDDYQFWFSNRVKMLSTALNGKDVHLFISYCHDYLENKAEIILEKRRIYGCLVPKQSLHAFRPPSEEWDSRYFVHFPQSNFSRLRNKTESFIESPFRWNILQCFGNWWKVFFLSINSKQIWRHSRRWSLNVNGRVLVYEKNILYTSVMPSFKSIFVNVYKTVSVEAAATNRSKSI